MNLNLRTFSTLAYMLIAAGGIATSPASACGHSVVLSNWQSCAIAPLSDGGGGNDWAAVPSWVKDPVIRRYFFDDPRLLANHGVCNAKFHRVTLCLPGWQESSDKDACWYLICSGFQAKR